MSKRVNWPGGRAKRRALRPLAKLEGNGQRPFFQIGNQVNFAVGRQIKAVGQLTRLRETTHLEYELDSRPGVRFARQSLAALQNLRSQIETKDNQMSAHHIQHGYADC
ncbi:MAG: hypothetical protein IPM76_24070 [Chloroflexi bacterium]|nr:hypothetical protein [Chloroflexota bacterium]